MTTKKRDPRIVTAKEVAEMLGVSYSQVVLMEHKGTLKRIVTPRPYRIRRPLTFWRDQVEALRDGTPIASPV